MDLEQYYLVARLDYALRRAGRVSRLWYRYLKSLLAFSLSSRTSKIISTVAPRLSAVKIAMELYDASCTKTGCRSSHLGEAHWVPKKPGAKERPQSSCNF